MSVVTVLCSKMALANLYRKSASAVCSTTTFRSSIFRRFFLSMTAARPAPFTFHKAVSTKFFSTDAADKTSEQNAQESQQQKDAPQQENMTKENDKTTQNDADQQKPAPSERLAELENRIKELEKEILYNKAEQENIRKIAKKDIQIAKDTGIKTLAKGLLDVADDLKLCLNSIKTEDLEGNAKLKTLYEGVQLSNNELKKVFKFHGLVEFDPMGEKFTTEFHEALFQQPHDSLEPGTVCSVVKTGYMLKDLVLRPAEVGVVQQSPQAHAAATGSMAENESPPDETNEYNNENNAETPENKG